MTLLHPQSPASQYQHLEHQHIGDTYIQTTIVTGLIIFILTLTDKKVVIVPHQSENQVLS
jgi:hypothetical protein